MSESSQRMAWAYPGMGEDPWYSTFQSMIAAIDVSGYAHREDRSLIFAGGGTISWVLGTETLTWTGIIQINSPITGRLLQVEANSIVLEQGEVWRVPLVRFPLTNAILTSAKGATIPSDDNAISIAVRIGDDIYFRTGMSLGDGDTSEGIAPVPASGGGGIGSFADMGMGYSYTEAGVPIEEVVGQKVIDGFLVGGAAAYFTTMMTPTLAFTGGGEVAEIRLYDLGPKAGPPAVARLVATLSTLTTGGPQVLEEALIVVPGGVAPDDNKILDSARMYEVRVTSAATVGDTIFVGSVGIEVR